jgi:hypothetical protein
MTNKDYTPRDKELLNLLETNKNWIRTTEGIASINDTLRKVRERSEELRRSYELRPGQMYEPFTI